MRKHGPEFVEKLYSILEEKSNLPYIVWSPSDTSFIIINPLEFGQAVLSNHFKHSNLSSFVRQLNKYDFHKIKSTNNTFDRYGPKIWEFENINFKRNRIDLLSKIKRKKGNSKKASNNLIFGFDSENKDTGVINTLKAITRYFQVIMEDLLELKKDITREKYITTHQYPVHAYHTSPIFHILLCENESNSNTYSTSILSSIENIKTNILNSMDDVDATNILKKTMINMIIISVDFPGIWNIVHQIRENNHILPIILLVNNSNNKDYIRYLSRGISEIIVKPYHHETMTAVLKKYYISNKK
ncbi:Heat shock transcription factor [Spraguea lophii 42_110]|uniref:Heat shock transcription factor n=1 Tax=Spraguea lophii (strain 42_110) TaxID=1358809 RepID=S7W8P1_SPRLO|nr:Heat shock transcription factor [Spraguea lophii 42_110]